MQQDFKTVFQTTVHAPVDKVWHALTDAGMVRQYFFGSNLETDWKPGSPIRFTGEYEGKTYLDKGVVQEYVPNEKLAFSYLSSWSNLPDEPQNYLLVSYSVEPISGTETRLTVTQTNYDEARRQHSRESWKAVMEGMKKLVE
jgi:uncharacterized protein YndB with AHSA1/START domain